MTPTIALTLFLLAGPAIGQAMYEKYKIESTEPYAHFGQAVAISGTRAVIGSYGSDGFRGKAVVMRLDGDGWQQEAELAPAGEPLDYFGISVDIDQGTVVVGAHGEQGSTGSAYVYELGLAGWGMTARLAAPDGIPGDWFGVAVAVAGDHILVGAHLRGAVYAFARQGEEWSYTQKLAGSPVDAAFGSALSMDGRTAAVGAWFANLRGAVYVYERGNDGDWRAVRRLSVAGQPGDAFGISVSVSGGTVAVGAYAEDGKRGAVYLFNDRTVQRVQPALPAVALFGYRVALSGERLVVGAYGVASASELYKRGSAYGYELGEDGVYRQSVTLAASDSTAGAEFGKAVAIDGNQALVGASEDGDTGSVYAFGGAQ